MPGDDVLDALRDFVREREWSQFHTPRNLAKSISIESRALNERASTGLVGQIAAGLRRRSSLFSS
ncbi:hypothetical protein [Rathayibacter rathayi]|uniref:hypothetical protein n=1 Tax=Rathayibacter rathayi TaxID=33887 RepID=UPI003B967923